MTDECRHNILSVTWCDDAAYYERQDQVTINNDLSIEEQKRGNWEVGDGGWGDENGMWLEEISCRQCDFVLLSNAEKITRRLKCFELAIIKKIREKGA